MSARLPRMCGRFTLDTAQVDFEEFSLTRISYQPPSSFNIAPTTGIATIRDDGDGHREMVELRWGLIPSWAKRDAKLPLMINARAETVASKPSYRSAFKSRRCVVPATGYYEWKKLPDGSKQPFYFTRQDGRPIAFAGLWEGETVATITTTPNAEAARIHDRMPVIVQPENLTRFLNPEPLSEGEQKTLLAPSPDGLLKAWPVSRLVGNVRNNSPGLIEPTDFESR